LSCNILLVGGSGGVPKIWGHFKGAQIFSADGYWKKDRLNFCLKKKPIVIKKFFSSSSRIRKFFIYKNNYLSSFHRFSAIKNNRYSIQDFKICGIKKINPTTIDSFAREKNLTFHALDIDCQGHALEVLKGANASLKKILLVKCEIDFLELYKNCASAGSVLDYMRKKGFRLLRTYACGNRNFPYSFDTAKHGASRSDGFIAWMDCIFLRDPYIIKKESNEIRQHYKTFCSVLNAPSICKTYGI